jgi:peroxin-13
MGGYGGYGSGMYGGMSGMGGMGGMGGYGSMYGGGMYGGVGGMQGDPNNPNSLTHGFTQSTQATFQIIESIVGAFGGFAQMLESTYMATHSSFFGEFLNPAKYDSTNTRSNGIRSRAVR